MIELVESNVVLAALHSPDLAPPPPPASVGTASCAHLRASMARFSHGALHAERRQIVDTLIAGIDPAVVGSAAQALVEELGRSVDTLDVVGDVAYRVPTLALLNGLGLAPTGLVGRETDALLGCLVKVVKVIGRGVAATAESDAACEQLLSMLQRASAGQPPTDPVVLASVLYQNHDATAALVIEMLMANLDGQPRQAAVRRTVRVATFPVVLQPSGTLLKPGEAVGLDLAGANLEFGAGPHQCPGSSRALTIASTIVQALAAEGFAVVKRPTTFDANGRPEELLMQKRSSADC